MSPARERPERVCEHALILVLVLYGFMCVSNGFKRLSLILRLFTQQAEPGSPDLTLTKTAHFTEASWKQRIPGHLAQSTALCHRPFNAPTAYMAGVVYVYLIGWSHQSEGSPN